MLLARLEIIQKLNKFLVKKTFLSFINFNIHYSQSSSQFRTPVEHQINQNDPTECLENCNSIKQLQY